MARNRTCGHCGTSRFGLIRHRVAFQQFCSLLCKEQFAQKRAQQLSENKRWFAYLSRASPSRT
jgi:hypothetical protein